MRMSFKIIYVHRMNFYEALQVFFEEHLITNKNFLHTILNEKAIFKTNCRMIIMYKIHMLYIRIFLARGQTKVT